jgi:hypothetical protein
MLSARSPAVTALSTLLQSKPSVEFVNAPARIHQLLFARVERVALGAYFDFYVLFRTARLNDLPTGAPYSGGPVAWVYSLFQDPLTSL